MWCYVVWCDVEKCSLVWCYVVWKSAARCGVVWRSAAWCGVVWCGEGFSLLDEEADHLVSSLTKQAVCPPGEDVLNGGNLGH